MKEKKNGALAIYIIGLIIFLIIFFVLKAYLQYEGNNFNMVLQVMFTMLTMVFQGFYIFFFLYVVLALFNIILVILALTILKKHEKIGEKIADGINWILEVKHLVLIIVLISCFVPFADTAAYKVADKKVVPIMVVVRQFMDVFEEPVEVVISDCGKGIYTQILPGRRGKTTSMSGEYIMFTAEEKEYVTPVTSKMREIMSWAEFNDMEYKVLMYPHSGMVVEFLEVPQSRYADNQEMLDRLVSSKGEPYGIIADETGIIKVIRNTAYKEEDYIEYGISFAGILHLYKGQQEYVEYDNIGTDICYTIDMREDGLHKFVVVNQKELELSKVIVVYIENGKVDYYDYDTYNKVYIQ